MPYIIIITIVLCLLLWKWQQKMIGILVSIICAFVLVFIWSIIDRKLDNQVVEKLDCAVVNLYSFHEQSLQDKKKDKKIVSSEEVLAVASESGLLGRKSYDVLRKIKDQVKILDGEQNVSYIDNKIVSTSFVENAARECSSDSDLYIIIYNNSNKVISNEKMKLSVRKFQRSTDLISGLDQEINEDIIIQPQQVVNICKSFPLLKLRRIDPSAVTLDIEMQRAKVINKK